MSVVSAIASIGSSAIGAGASMYAARKAAEAQERAAERAADTVLELDARQRQDFAPWRSAGQASLNALRGRLGLGYWERVLPGGASADQPISGAQTIQGGAQWAADKAIPFDQAPSWGADDELVKNRLHSARTQPQTRRVPIYEWKEVPNPNYEVGGWDQGQPAFIRKRVLTGYKKEQVPGRRPVEMGQESGGQWRYVEPTGEGPPGYEPVPEFEESPGYEFTRSEGLRAMDNVLSAMGRRRSGAHMKAAGQYAKDLASTEYDNFLNRWYRGQEEKRRAFSEGLNPYLALAGLGQTATGQSAQLSGSGGRTAAGAYLAGGDARAAGYINQANALTGGMTGLGQNLLYLNALRNLPQQQGQGYYNPLLWNPYQMGNVGPQASYGTSGR